MVNEKLCNEVLDTRVFRGSSVNSDYFLVISEIVLITRWYEPLNKKYSVNAAQVYLEKSVSGNYTRLDYTYI